MSNKDIRSFFQIVNLIDVALITSIKFRMCQLHCTISTHV